MTFRRLAVGGVVLLAASAAILYAMGWRMFRNPSDGRFYVVRKVRYGPKNEPRGAAGPLQSVEILTPDPAIDSNLGRDAFLAHTLAFVDRAQRAFASSPREFGVSLTLVYHPDRDMTIDVATSGDPDAATLKRAMSELADPGLRTRIDDVSIRFNLIAGRPMPEKPAPAGGSASGFSKLDELKNICELRLDRYAEVFQGVDPKFEGVVSFGKDLAARKSKGVEELTSQNPHFWRAVMEMVRQDPSIGFAKAYLLAADGRLSAAEAWLMISVPGMDGKAFGADYEQLKAAILAVREQIGPEVQKGIVLHDQSKFDEAIAIYDGVIAKDPKNAWALYEKSFAMLMKDKDGSEAAREELYAVIRAIDPFYFEAYQGKLDARRKEQLTALLQDILPFAKGKAQDGKAYERFAFGCEKAGLADYAAQVFWKLSALEHFWRNLEALGLEAFVKEHRGAAADSTSDTLDDDAILEDCSSEIGLLCSGAGADARKARRCLAKQDAGSFTPKCRAALGGR